MFADLYAEAIKVGVSPLEVDLMEFWQVAAMFGLHRPPSSEEAAAVRSKGATREERNLEHARRRTAHAQGRAPKPEARVPSMEDKAFMLQFQQALNAE